MYSPLPVSSLPSRLICQVQLSIPQYRCLGVKWYVRSPSPLPSSANMSSSYLSSRGYFVLTLISLNRITYIPFCATSNT